MPMKLKPPRSTGLGLMGLVSRPTTYIPPRPPEGPSCSRWLSCSCCRNINTKATYFSSNRGHNTNAASKTSKSLLPHLEFDSEPALSPSDSQSQRHAAARLPLPPTLPYSPDSVPFQRHLQYLSLAVVSTTPEDSWRTYLALHPTLRRYIPDDLFRSLLAHQLTSQHPKQRWARSLSLVKFAKKCGVQAKNLGEENLKNVLQAGLIYTLRTRVSEIDNYTDKLDRLWNQVMGCRDVPLDLRKGYLQTFQRRSDRRDKVDQIMKRIVERFGFEGIEKEVGRIISLYHGSKTAKHLESLELAAWCAERGRPLPDDTLLVMLRIISNYEAQGIDPLPTLQASVGSLPLGPGGAEFLDNTLHELGHRLRRPAQRVIDAIADQSSVATLARNVLDMLGERAPDVHIALDALDSLLKRNADAESVVTAIMKRLAGRQRQDAAIVRLAGLLIEHDINKLQDSTIRSLYQLVTHCIPNEDAYTLSRTIYPLARAHGFRWHHHSAWQSILNQALRSRQLQFASRLFADAHADQLVVDKDDYRAMVRAVGMSRSASRPILLERYIKEYLELGLPLEPFILAMVEGLTYSKNANDASLALELSRRILQDRPIPTAAAELMIGKLASSPNLGHLRQAVFLLDFTSTVESYNHVIFSIVAHSRSDPTVNQMSRVEALGHAVGMYERMMQKEVPVSARTVSLLLRALVDARRITSAMGVYSAAIDNGYSLKPNSVGRLMVRLILDDRLDEALQVEDRWRASAGIPSGKRYDRAIVGARVLLDTKLGHTVDLENIAKKTGWSGTGPFLRFVESLKPRMETSEDEQAEQVGAENRDGTDVRPAITATATDRGPQIRPWNTDKDKIEALDSVGIRSVMT